MELKKDLMEKFIRTYEKYIAPATFIAGFTVDALTLRRIDLLFEHLVILVYLFLAGVGIIVFNLHESGRLRFRRLESLIVFAPVIIQYAFGGLFSAFIIFYTKSSAIGQSWLFLAALAVLWIGNERFRKRYQRFTFQLSVFFTALFSYSIFAVPIILKNVGDLVFIISGLASLGAVFLLIALLFVLMPVQARRISRAFLFSVGGIYLAFNILYFANVIPPIPLSLKESGIYHSVELVNGVYEASYEKAPWYLPLQETGLTYHWRPGERVYYFTSVFAPSRFNVNIFHQWSFYDESAGQWVKKESVRFPISGGRDGGYRGYSFKTGVQPGRWRVTAMTETGQIIGRETFTVVLAEAPVELEYGIK